VLDKLSGQDDANGRLHGARVHRLFVGIAHEIACRLGDFLNHVVEEAESRRKDGESREERNGESGVENSKRSECHLLIIEMLVLLMRAVGCTSLSTRKM